LSLSAFGVCKALGREAAFIAAAAAAKISIAYTRRPTKESSKFFQCTHQARHNQSECNEGRAHLPQGRHSLIHEYLQHKRWVFELFFSILEHFLPVIDRRKRIPMCARCHDL
jgi:hypothetical protein